MEKQLAVHVLLQAIKDAASCPPKLKKNSSVRALASHKQELQRWRKNRDEARHFLINDKDMFPFWCQVAGLNWKSVRFKLLPQIGRVKLRELVRSLTAA